MGDVFGCDDQHRIHQQFRVSFDLAINQPA
jgi:hypothetical protein